MLEDERQRNEILREWYSLPLTVLMSNFDVCQHLLVIRGRDAWPYRIKIKCFSSFGLPRLHNSVASAEESLQDISLSDIFSDYVNLLELAFSHDVHSVRVVLKIQELLSMAETTQRSAVRDQMLLNGHSVLWCTAMACIEHPEHHHWHLYAWIEPRDF